MVKIRVKIIPLSSAKWIWRDIVWFFPSAFAPKLFQKSLGHYVSFRLYSKCTVEILRTNWTSHECDDFRDKMDDCGKNSNFEPVSSYTGECRYKYLTNVGRISIWLCNDIKKTSQINATFEFFCRQLRVLLRICKSRKVCCVCQIISPQYPQDLPERGRVIITAIMCISLWRRFIERNVS